MTEFVTAADGTDIAFDIAGQGPPVLLIHGFGASRTITWKNTGWYQTLEMAGRQVIAVDCRGHGESGKPHLPAAYDEERMTADLVAVLAALRVPAADIMGYSMGGFLAMRLMADAPGRVRRAVIAGVGATYFHPDPERAEIIAAGLAADDPATVTDATAKEFRSFGEKAGNDLAALAACMRRPRKIFTPEELRAFSQPVLVADGESDTTAGAPGPLADAFANGRALVVPKKNHHSTVGDRVYKDAVVEFLS
jgi:pimeloyl-ACP methyl ester carboxylesterase